MKNGALGALAALAMITAACGEAETADGNAVAQANEEAANECEQQNQKECVEIEAEHNITHVFLDFACDAGDYEVTVETEQFGNVNVTDWLEDNGGPSQEIDRDFWFVVPGPDKAAKVCVEFAGEEKAEVQVSYKAANVASGAGVLFSGGNCEPCETNVMQ